jgi:hypothetical protein
MERANSTGAPSFGMFQIRDILCYTGDVSSLLIGLMVKGYNVG